MKKIFLYCVVLFCIFFVDSKTSIPLKEVPPGYVLKAPFSQQRYLTGIPKPIVSKGELLLWKGKGLIWKIKAPFPSVILITKKNLYQIEDGKKVPMINTSQMGHEGALFEMMSKLLDGSVSELKEFKLVSLPSLQGRWKVSLTPTQTSLQGFLSSIEMEGNEHISNITIYRSNGDKDEIFMSNHILSSEKDVDKTLSLEEKTWFDD
jgi:hypothetical protein